MPPGAIFVFARLLCQFIISKFLLSFVDFVSCRIMWDPILLFGGFCLGLAMLWFFGAFDEERGRFYKITLSDGSLSFHDKGLELGFGFENPEDLSELKHIPFSLANRTKLPIEVKWNSCRIIDPDGLERKLLRDLFTDVPAGEHPSRQSRIEPGVEIDELLIPQDNLGAPSLRTSSLKRRLLLAQWSDREGFDFMIHLQVVSGEESKSYEIGLNAVRVVSKAY